MFQKILAHVSANERTPNTSAQQILTGDFNGDGITDLAVPFIVGSGGNGDPIRFYLGDGRGSYTEATQSLFAGAKPYPIYAARIFGADFNRDGRTDVLVPDFGVDRPPFPGGESEVILSNARGTLTLATDNLPHKLNQTHGAAVGDINNDGNPDAILINLNAQRGDSIEILIGDGSGGFVENDKLAPLSFQNTGWNIGNTWGALSDVNHDGSVDLILGPGPDGKMPAQVYLNNGHGDFSGAKPIALPSTAIAMPHALQIEPVDLNRDGHTDLVLSLTSAVPGTTGYYSVPYLQFLVNDGSGHFRDETAERLPQSTAPGVGWIKFVQHADVNHDGFVDLVTSWALNASPWMETRIFLNDGFGNFQRLNDTIPGMVTAVTDSQSNVLNFVSVRYALEDQGQGLFVIENDAVGTATPVIRAPAFSTLPSAVVHRFFNQGASPNAEKSAALSDFSFGQFLAYKQTGVARPELGPYEALGRAFAETIDFQNNYGSLTSAALVERAYKEVFERPATPGQQGHFQSQVAYFERIYGEAGMAASTASLLAKGAVIGQMLGFAAFDETSQHAYISAARTSIGLTPSESGLVGVAQSDPAAGYFG